VFDVDVSEGMPPLKLPYNVSGEISQKKDKASLTVENPWISAQKFLDRYELPSSYTEQVVSFIEKNTGGTTLGLGDASTYVDPYTGAARYTGASSSSSGPSGRYVDPFTGERGRPLDAPCAHSRRVGLQHATRAHCPGKQDPAV